MLIDIVYYLLLAALVVFALWYVFDWSRGADRQNKQWVEAKKAGEVSKPLLKAYRFYPDKQRFVLFWLQLKRLSAVVPDDAVMAELGVYRGQTARLLQLMAPQRQLFLFDTFEGFREEDLEDESGKALAYTSASFADTSMALVQEKLSPLDKTSFFKGDFSSLISEIPEVKYAFVTIDADLAAPTLAGLRYFYPRLYPGGVIIVHDYNENWPSLMEAVDAFLTTIPEQPTLIPDQDNSLVIVKNALV